MNANELDKVKRFMSDVMMNEAVYSILLTTFLKRREGEDTEMKAARFLATELLAEGWKELERTKAKEEREVKNSGQVGL